MVGVSKGNRSATSQDQQDACDPTSLPAMAQSRWRQARYLELRRISCQFQDGVLTLRGRVPTYHLKQLAQTLVGSLEGVRSVCNELDVDPLSRHAEVG